MDRIAVNRYNDMADEVGPVYIEEVAGWPCLVHGRRLVAGRREFVDMPAVTLAGNRSEYWYLRIMDPLFQDADFEQEWRAQYGNRWPLVAPFTTHPALASLYDRFSSFQDAWVDHYQEREATIYREILAMEKSDDEGSVESDDMDD